jgi:ABC-type dipeptide/oligopeptide/nickel transport system permease subunit
MLAAAASPRGGPGAGALLVALLAAVAVLAPLLLPHDPLAQDLAARNAPPGGGHWLGRDHLGRDVLSRLVLGAQLSLGVAAGATAVALVLGAGLGLAAAALGAWAERAVFALFDVVRALPSVLLALALLVAMGVGTGPVMLALGIAFAPLLAEVARAAWRREQAAGYVAAARVLGAGPLPVLVRHVAPNIAGSLVTQAAIVLPRAITSESVLSFFGLGVSPETPTWGRMIAAGVPYIERAPHAIAAPVVALALASLAFTLAADRLRIALDPLRGAR